MINYCRKIFKVEKDEKSFILEAHTNDTFSGYSEIIKCKGITRTSIQWGNRSWQNFDYEKVIKKAICKLFGTVDGVSCYEIVNNYSYKVF